MYPVELKQYIDERNGALNKDETKFVIDINLHPQLNHIEFNPYNNTYDMWDNEGNYYHFIVRQGV